MSNYNCKEIIGNLDLDKGEALFYSPRNDLDVQFFNELINNKLLDNKFIKKCDIGEDETELFHVVYFPKLCLHEDYEHTYCTDCKLQIPIDMEYYNYDETNKNICKKCYNKNDYYKNNTYFTKRMIESGLDNINDWIFIFYLVKECVSVYCFEVYCNLNENSPYYKRFAVNNCCDSSGEEIIIIKETCIEDILYFNDKNEICIRYTVDKI